jgi:hypothetical protein
MDRNNGYIPRVIEPVELPVRRSRRCRFAFSPRQALHYNEHPDAIMEVFDQREYGAVLREIERHVIAWESQRTPAQAEWSGWHRRRNYLSTGAAAKAIVRALND